MERDFQRRSFAPIQVGEELDVTIEAAGSKGDGIAKVKGFVIFIAGTKQGERVKIKITKVFRKVGFGEVVGSSTSEAGSEQAKEQSEDSKDENSEESYENEEDSEDKKEEY